MAHFFTSVADVEARVRNDPTNGKAMLEIELASGVYDTQSRNLAKEWLAMDNARLDRERLEAREAWQHEFELRTIDAAETQAREAIRSTRYAFFALGVSVVGLIVAGLALLKP